MYVSPGLKDNVKIYENYILPLKEMHLYGNFLAINHVPKF